MVMVLADGSRETERRERIESLRSAQLAEGGERVSVRLMTLTAVQNRAIEHG